MSETSYKVYHITPKQLTIRIWQKQYFPEQLNAAPSCQSSLEPQVFCNVHWYFSSEWTDLEVLVA